jgi:hypothetical protein
MFRKCQVIKLSGNLAEYSEGIEMQILVSEVRLRKRVCSESTSRGGNRALSSFFHNETMT